VSFCILRKMTLKKVECLRRSTTVHYLMTLNKWRQYPFRFVCVTFLGLIVLDQEIPRLLWLPVT